MTRRLRPLRLWAALLATALGAALFWRAPLLHAAARWLDVGQTAGRTDYVLVLPGDESMRPLVAAALYRAGLAERVLVMMTETSPRVEDGLIPPTHEIVHRVLEQRSVPADDVVLLDGSSSTTFGDAQVLRRFLLEHPRATVTVVTNDFHTRRARWVLRRVLGEEAHRLRMVSAPVDGVPADRWWTTEQGLHVYLSEYLKFAYYLLRYGDLRLYGLLFLLGACLTTRAWRRRSWLRHRRASPAEQATDHR